MPRPVGLGSRIRDINIRLSRPYIRRRNKEQGRTAGHQAMNRIDKLTAPHEGLRRRHMLRLHRLQERIAVLGYRVRMNKK